MFLIDDLLLMPARGLLAMFEELHQRALEEKQADALSARDQLVNLYMQFETGQISAAEFDDAEQRLVGQLGESGPDRQSDSSAAAPAARCKRTRSPAKACSKRSRRRPATTRSRP